VVTLHSVPLTLKRTVTLTVGSAAREVESWIVTSGART
jgi:hypothetical protein